MSLCLFDRLFPQAHTQARAQRTPFADWKIADEWTSPSHGMLNTKQRENYVVQSGKIPLFPLSDSHQDCMHVCMQAFASAIPKVWPPQGM
jgi:hypothetical protein